MNAEIDISRVILKTERLSLRPWRKEDLQDFFEYASMPEVGPMAGWEPHKSAEESEYILNRFIEGKKTFALVFEGKVIGSLGVEMYQEERFPEFENLRVREIGFAMSRDYWGRGLMPEAVKEVMRYLFENVKLDLLLCGRFVWNSQSGRVQEKCGFHQYAFGTYTTATGKVEDEVTSIIYRDEWLKMQGNIMHRYSDRIWYSDYDERTDRPVIGYVAGDNASILIDAGNSPRHAREILDEIER